MNIIHFLRHKIISTVIAIFVPAVRMRKDYEMVWLEMPEKQIFRIYRIVRRGLYAIKMQKQRMTKDITRVEKEVYNNWSK